MNGLSRRLIPLVSAAAMVLSAPGIPAATTNFFTLAPGDSVTNGVPAPGAGNIEEPDSVDVYDFVATAGQVVFFDDRAGVYASGQRMYLYDDTGALVWWDQLDDYDASARLRLERGGAYRIEVRSNFAPPRAGTYSFKLWAVIDQAFDLALGQMVTNGAPAAGAGVQEMPGSWDVFHFTVTPGQAAFLDDYTQAYLSRQIVGFDPSGTQIFTKALGAGSAIQRITFSQGGTYRIEARAGTQDSQIGPYEFVLWPVTDQNFTIAIGDSVTNGVPEAGAGNIEGIGDRDLYHFTAAPGQVVFFDDRDAVSRLYARLYDETNGLILGDELNGYDPTGARLTLARGGNYRVEVGAYFGDQRDVGAYSFKLWAVTDQTFTLNLGEQIEPGSPAPGAGVFETPGSGDTYLLTVPAAQEVFFHDQWAEKPGFHVYVYDQTNRQVLYEAVDGYSSYQRLTLDRGGTYRLVFAAGSQATDIGAYRFKVWPVVDQEFSLTFGETVTNGVPAAGAGNLESPGDLDIYHFSAEPGQTIFIDDLTPTNSYLLLTLYDAINLLGSEYLNDSDAIGRITLTAGGNYRAVVSGGSAAARMGPYSFKIDFASPAITTPPHWQTVWVGQTATFTVEAIGEAPLAYQWQFNNTNLPGANAAVLTLINVQAGQAGGYRAVVTNAYGAATSVVAQLYVRTDVVDLQVVNVIAPSVAEMGQPSPLRFMLTNAGTTAASGPWQNRVLAAGQPDGSGAQSLGLLTFTGSLVAGGSLTRTQSVIFPPGLWGGRYLGIEADGAHQVFEIAETNNLAFATTPTWIRAADLVPLMKAIPPSAQFGQTVSLTWAVTNRGDAAAGANWSDGVYLSPTGGVGTNSVLLGTWPAAAESPLEPGAGYVVSREVTLPLREGLESGNWFLAVLADVGDAQAESDETNNLTAPPLSLALPPLPDLLVLAVSVPSILGPGREASLQWMVTNQGAASVTEPWHDSLLLSNDVTGILTLVEVACTNALAPGASLGRSVQIVLPPQLPAGTYELLLVADARGEILETDESHNTGAAADPVVVPAALVLQLPVAQVAEGAGATVLSASVIRNGDLSVPIEIALSSSDTNEIATPLLVPLGAGQSAAIFDLFIRRDGEVDGPAAVTISASAAGYAKGEANLAVLDSDRPRLVLTLASNAVVEGATVAATIARAAAAPEPLTVSVRSSHASQVSTPVTVTIPAGSNAWTFAILAVDDSLLEPPFEYLVTASAEGHESATVPMSVLDNDLPEVALTLTEHSVGEGAGLEATTATVTRGVASPRPMTVEIVSSDPSAARAPLRVVIPAGRASVSFPVAAVDDAMLDGPQTAVLTPYVLASDSIEPLAAGIPDTLTVLDDDGPALRVTLDRAVVAEGLNPACTLTVFRNTPPTNHLLLNLLSSDTGEAVVPASVTIPEGASSAPAELATVPDGVSDGNQTVTITARAAGHGDGVGQLVVTDTELPDLAVEPTTAPAAAETESYVTVSYRVVNQGLAASTTNFLTRLFLSRDPFVGDDTLVAQFQFEGSIPPGQYFGQTTQVRIPQGAGEYWLVVVTDAEDAVAELLEHNNVRLSATPIVVQPAYSAWVRTDLEAAVAGTPVPMHGQATNRLGAPAAYKLVNLQLRTQGTRRTISALTDDHGQFATTWTPLPNEAGRYEILATHPGVIEGVPQDEFRLLGLSATPAAASLRIIESSNLAGRVVLRNPGDLPLTGLNAVTVGKPAGLGLDLALTNDALAALGTVNLEYALSAPTVAAAGPVQVRVTTAEGAAVDIFFNVLVEALRPRLVSVPDELLAGMVRGRQTPVELKVVNAGGVATGPLTVLLPDVPWLRLAGTNPVPSVPPGGTNWATVNLLLVPPPDLPLGSYRGTLMIAGTNSSLALSYEFRAVADGRGDLLLTAVDELTFYAEGSPNLAGARVKIRDAMALTDVAGGVTDANGEFLAEALPEAFYEVEVTAPKHTPFRQTMLLKAAETNRVQAFLSRRTVQYTWTVEPIQVEDRYRVTIETTFETAVPLPVITMEPTVIDLAAATADELQIELKITNHGLVAAQNAVLHFPGLTRWSFSPLLTDVGVLPAMSSLAIPVTIRRQGAGNAAARLAAKDAGGDPCFTEISLEYEVPCKKLTDQINSLMDRIGLPEFMRLETRYRTTAYVPTGAPGCSLQPTPPIAVAPNPVKIPGPPNFPFSPTAEIYSIYVPPEESYTWKECPELECLIKAAIQCIPFMDCVSAPNDCRDAFKDGASSLEKLDCFMSAAGCLVPGAGRVSCIYGFIRCHLGVKSAGGPGTASTRHTFYLGSGVTPAVSEPASASGTFTGDAYTPYRRGLAGFYDALIELAGTDGDLWLNERIDTPTGAWFERFAAAASTLSEAGRLISPAENAALVTGGLPVGVTTPAVQRLVDRWNLTVQNWSAGLLRPSDAPPGSDTNFMDAVRFGENLRPYAEGEEIARQNGFTGTLHAIAETARIQLSEGAAGVCARVRLRTEQDAVLSRDAFRATLEIENSEEARLEKVEVTLQVQNATGQDATPLFGMRTPDLEGLSGVDGAGILAAQSTGTARWILIPTREAAPSNSVTYFVAGRLNYTQAGMLLSVPLAAAAITVMPSPSLHVHYFHERDVFSDDPFTDGIEPSVPFNLAVLVQNRGRGVAQHFRLSTAQPQIIENEKGLLIDFQILATEVGGRSLSPTLTADFGNIEPGETALARWLMSSTLQGLFIDYQASFQHLDAIGNLKLSLLDEIAIHEMIHLVKATGAFDDGQPDFLVNDVGDPYDRPDTLYLSDGSRHSVAVVGEATHNGPPSAGRLEIQLDAVMPAGWTYLRVPDPADRRFNLARVQRADGPDVLLHTNVWVTDRTFLELGRPPRRENILHLLDFDSPGRYTLHYREQPGIDTTPPNSAVAALPPNSYATIPVNWSGVDGTDGSGVATFDIYVSENDGPFVPWRQGTTARSGFYTAIEGRRYAFFSVATDAAGNREAAPIEADAETRVTLSNAPPVVVTGGPFAFDEGTIVTVSNPATDPDSPSQQLTFSLGPGAPAGAAISAATGLITWPTGEADGPGTNVITVIVRDNGLPSLSATGWVTVVISEVNRAPELMPVADCVVNERETIRLEVEASDSDRPAQTLLFQLGPGAPTGATITPLGGAFLWTPTELQGPSTNRIAVMVRDRPDALALSATQTFLVTVRDTRPDFVVSLGGTNLFAGQSGTVPLGLNSGLDLVEIDFLLELSSSGLTNLVLEPTAGFIGSATLAPASALGFRAHLAASPGASLQGDGPVARLDFHTSTNPPSALVHLRPQSVSGVRGNGQAVPRGGGVAGGVVVLNHEPLLLVDHGAPPRLSLFGRPGLEYEVQSNTNLAAEGWLSLGIVSLTNISVTLEIVPDRNTLFYRARSSPP